MAEDFTTFIELLSLIDFDVYTPLPEPHKDTFLKLKQLRKHGYDGNNDILIQEIQNTDQPNLIRVFAASVIHVETVSGAQLQLLGNQFLMERKAAVRTALAKKFELIPLDETIPYLIGALIDSNDPQFRVVVAQSIHSARASMDWKQKVNVLMTAVSDPGYFPEYLDMGALVTAVSPPIDQRQLSQNRYLLADVLISEAVKQNSRRLGEIIAALLVESCGCQPQLAFERINHYIANHQDARKSLNNLQASINAFIAPRDLQDVLAENYQQPLEELHQEISKKWRFSIFSAQASLWSKISVSILVSLGAIVLLGVGILKLFDQNQWPESFLSIAIGLVFLLITITYNGSIHESRKALVEIGTASTVYATFTQQRLNVSSQHAVLTLQNRLTTADLKEASQLLNQAMKEAIEMLRGENKPVSLEDFLTQFD